MTQARRARLAMTSGIVPDVLWFVLIAIDHPFAGSVKVRPETLSVVLEAFGAASES